MILRSTPAFDRSFRKLTRSQKEDFKKAIFLFNENNFHPFLKTHKLRGRWKNFWAFSLNYSDRCIFKYIKYNEVLLYDIGPHKIYEKQ